MSDTKITEEFARDIGLMPDDFGNALRAVSGPRLIFASEKKINDWVESAFLEERGRTIRRFNVDERGLVEFSREQVVEAVAKKNA